MITDTESALTEINRLSGKKGWPYLSEGQLELVRVAKKYARDLPHLNAAITQLSESLDHCPDGRELKLELQGKSDQIWSDLPRWEGFREQ